MNTHTKQHINHVAILGAGVMGAQIAAHFVNAGFRATLFDLVDADGKNANVRSRRAIAAIKKLKKLDPAPLGVAELANHIVPANYEDDLNKLKDCGLVIEAIAENKQWKLDLYERIEPYLKPDAILATNTSSIPIASLAEGVSASRRAKFLGIHFFNPPRYMHLLEMIPHAGTDSAMLDNLETFFAQYLGKGVVRAKDTAGFIGNRIGVIAMMIVLHHAQKLGIAVDLADELTGTRIGRPKSATYRTMDVVGLDTMKNVAHELSDNLYDDPWHEHMVVPQWILDLIESGALGAKVKKGVYVKEDGVIKFFDPESKSYQPSRKKQIEDELKDALKKLANERFAALKELASDSKQAEFLLNVFADIFHYTAYHTKDIASNTRDIDLALRWGYGWEEGPFETWQSFGWQAVVNFLNQRIQSGQALCNAPLPDWVTDGRNGVHQFADGQNESWSPELGEYTPRSALPVYKKHWQPPHVIGYQKNDGKTLMENDAVRLWTMPEHSDGNIGIVSFKTKMNTLSFDVIMSLYEIIDKAEASLDGLIVYQPDGAFCAGANLFEVLMGTKYNRFEGEGDWLSAIKQTVAETFMGVPKLERDLPSLVEMIERLQHLFMRFKHSPIPVVSAVDGLALGGGCELILHSARVVATHESYVGLVEAGIGVLPAGSGTKEMTVRAYEQAKRVNLKQQLFPHIAKYFEQIAMGKVAKSALEAREFGYLRDSDVIIFNRNDLLSTAHEQVHALLSANYRPPQAYPVTVVGASGKSTLRAQVTNMLEGSFISEHDEKVALAISDTMSGGDIADFTSVSHEYLIKKEREHFLALLKTKKTQDRIEYMLKKGKPLRN